MVTLAKLELVGAKWKNGILRPKLLVRGLNGFKCCGEHGMLVIVFEELPLISRKVHHISA
jgi:hypothetical protein